MVFKHTHHARDSCSPMLKRWQMTGMLVCEIHCCNNQNNEDEDEDETGSCLATDSAHAQKSSSKDGAMEMRQTRSGGTATKPPRHAVVLVTAASDKTLRVK